MIRQTRTYLLGAMSGATLIAIAIAVSVLFVSAQVFSDWPMSALRGSGEEPAVSAAQSVSAAEDESAAAAATPGSDAAAADDDGASKAGTGASEFGAATVGSNPSGESAGSGGGSTSTPPSSSPGGDTGSGGGAAGGESQPSGSGGSSSSSANSGGGNDGPGGPTTTSSPSGTVTETVNGTAAGVDETALGGTLQGTGVTGVTEGVVNGLAGPESTVGKVVDETAQAVGGLLSPTR